MPAPAPSATLYSPIRETPTEYANASPRGCGCFRRFCFGWDDGGSHSYLLQERGGLHEETWLVTQLNKLKQLSELVAGPRWKNFIRKIGRLCHGQKQTAAAAQFQYSPESYALNFVGDRDEEEDGHLSHSFSSRFAPQKSAAL